MLGRKEAVTKLELAIDEVIAHIEKMGYTEAFGIEKRYVDEDKECPYLHMNKHGIVEYSKALKNLAAFCCMPYSTDLVSYKGCVVVLHSEDLYKLDKKGRRFIYEHELAHFRNNDPITFTNILQNKGMEALAEVMDAQEAICDITAAELTGITLKEYDFIKVQTAGVLAASLGDLFRFTKEDILNHQKDTKQYNDTVKYLRFKK